jgi:hypothetical protein
MLTFELHLFLPFIETLEEQNILEHLDFPVLTKKGYHIHEKKVSQTY